MSVWDDKDSPLSPKYGEQRFFRPARVVLHGDQTRASSYLPLARNLLGQLVQQDHILGGLPQSSRWVRMIDPHTAVNAPPASLTTMGVTAHIGYSHGQPHIEIWVRDIGDEELCLPRFGSRGKRRLSGIEEQANVAACEYMDPYFDWPQTGGVYLGTYKAQFGTIGFFTPTEISVTYPAYLADSDDTYTYFWRNAFSDTFSAIGTPFANDQEDRDVFRSETRVPGITGRYYPTSAGFFPFRTLENGDKVVLITTLAIIDEFNTDSSGLAQPVPVVGVYNLTTGSVLDTVVYPAPSLFMSPTPGLVYLTPVVLPVGGEEFFALSMTYTGYPVQGSAIDLEQAKFEANIFYSADSGSTYMRYDIKPLIGVGLELGHEDGYTNPTTRFNSPLNVAIQIAAVTAKFLAIGNKEALLALRLAKVEDRSIEGETYRGTFYTNMILKCTPTGVSVVYTATAWWGFPIPPSTSIPVKEPFDALQYWVYLGADVILGKFIKGHFGIDRETKYMRSVDRGETWEDVPANGLPTFRMNQFFGDFTLIEPYVKNEDGDVISMGKVLTTAYDDNAFRSYVSTDAGSTWVEAGMLSPTDEFYRVDSLLADDGGHNFYKINYFGDIADPAPFNPAIPELMQRPQP